MSLKTPKINVNGQLVDLRDTGTIVKVLTQKLRDEISSLEKDIVTVNQQKVNCKKFETLGNKLKDIVKPLTTNDVNESNIFDERVPLPVGITASELIAFVDINIQPKTKETGTIKIQPKQIATPEKWQSVVFTSKVSNVVQPSSGSNPQLFSAGSFKILVQNNAIASAQEFSSKSTSLVSDNLIQVGKILINDKSVSISASDSLDSLVAKINGLQIGVKASVVQQPNNTYKLVLKSEKIGGNNIILIDDPDAILTNLTPNLNGDGFFDPLEEYETVNLNVGDSLEKIAYKINMFEKTTNLHAEVFQISRGQFVLILKSLAEGITNKFKIVDNNIVLNGSTTGSVFKDTFNHPLCIRQAAQDAIVNIDDIDLNSPINTINIYDGITAKLRTTSTKPLQFEVKSDINAVFLAIKNLAEQYNLLRQIYDDDNQQNASYLQDNAVVNDAFHRIDSTFDMLTSTIAIIDGQDIGISKGILSMDTIENDQQIKKEYKNMMIVDQLKLFDGIKDYFDIVRKTFDSSFESSSANFAKPLFLKKIGINNNSLGTNQINLSLNVKLEDIKVKSKASIGFSNIANVVDASGQNLKKFKPGTFWLNGVPITISAGMTLNQIESAINAASNMSRINAVVSSTGSESYISLTQYSGSFSTTDDELKFKSLLLYDPNSVLQEVFSITRETSDFDVSSTAIPSSYITPGNTIVINGVSLSPTSNTIADFVNLVNSVSTQTGVLASANLNQQTGKFYLKFIPTKLQDIVIDNSGNALNNILFSITPSQQNDQKFFDTSNAVESTVKINGVQYDKTCVLSMAGDNVTSGGTIYIWNKEGDKMLLQNVEVLFLGSMSDSTEILISDGIASNIASELDAMFKLRQGYKQSTNAFLDVQASLDRGKKDIEQNLKNKQDRLSVQEKELIKKFSNAVAKFDEQDAYNELVDAIMNNKKSE